MSSWSLPSQSPSVLDRFFTPDTMSVHIKVGTRILSKVGRPGKWDALYADTVMDHDAVQHIADAVLEEIQHRNDAFLEIDRKLSKVVQMGYYRVVIVYPPLADALEMTIVRPVKRLHIDDYNLDPKVYELLQNKSQGILVSGAPGSGKTTFAQALVDVYVAKNKIIKTIESPRDLMVPEEVVQYSFTYGGHDEVRDILLLSRPDYTIYDEVRNTNDFMLYKDLRLTGIGLVWVIHASNPIDSIQRFVGNIELGIIPQVIDTVIYIEWGIVQEIYTLKLTVKTPSGMMSADLARPVVEVSSFLTDELRYELYSFGEQVVVIPLADIAQQLQNSPTNKLAEAHVKEFLDTRIRCPYSMSIKNDELILSVADNDKWAIIGKWWENIQYLEKELGMRISVKTGDGFDERDAMTDRPNKSWSYNRPKPPLSGGHKKKRR